jgi:hypothetical protein
MFLAVFCAAQAIRILSEGTGRLETPSSSLETGKWNVAFRPVQVGKEQLAHLLTQQGLTAHRYPGVVTKQPRESFGRTKTRQKAAQTFSSRAVDA